MWTYLRDLYEADAARIRQEREEGRRLGARLGSRFPAPIAIGLGAAFVAMWLFGPGLLLLALARVLGWN